MTALKTHTLTYDSGANTSTRHSINNQAGSWYLLSGEAWADYWVPASRSVSLS